MSFCVTLITLTTSSLRYRKMNSYLGLLMFWLSLGAVSGSPAVDVEVKRDEVGTGCQYCSEGPWAFAEGVKFLQILGNSGGKD